MYVKICGLDTADNARVAVEAGADAIGVVMSASSSRGLDAARARRIVDAVGDAADTVLVTNDLGAREAAEVASRLGVTVLQLHGPAYSEASYREALHVMPRVWRATSLADAPSLQVGAHGEEALLLDAATPGSGETWDVAALDGSAIDGPWLLAGGLTPANVAAAIEVANPWGVDVSSGVESSRAVKDPGLIREFIGAAKHLQLR
ncbi:phosphoribosylanthranilate isomerase [Pseudoclavibacter endophyticus]|uniref:N-(5'-phosphoribosyl)anthranilate isomerase n=1 Tax=Pseudoclavibacter endophyticus TaxID=1778590 RepID=A0A6H9WVB9_9MICO|nr:phosphoribosylanthranilate isomerase [Pseudoclavibacter endophyticus]